MQSISSRSAVSAVLAVVCCLVHLCAGPNPVLAEEVEPTTWAAVQEDVAAHLDQESYDEALAILEQAAAQLQGREFEISDLTLQILFGAGRVDEALTAWEQGLDEGFFYFVIPRLATYDGIRNMPRFRAALNRNNRRREEANQEAKPEFEVMTPDSYSPDESYPLLVVIHGGNQSIVKAKERWDPRAIGDDLIIAYVQSSRMADTKSYRWDLGGVDIYSAPTAQDEVLGLYEEIVAEYAVDTDRVSLAGFSQGGNLALTMAAEGTIPATGFIAGCPAIRTAVTPETSEAAAARGVRGTIFVGAEDWTANSVQASVTNFEEAGLPVNHIVMEGKGHEFPDDFDVVLRAAIEDILQ